SKVENDFLNICYLTDFNSFKAYKNIALFQQEMLYQNTHLKAILVVTVMHFDAPLTISQVSFQNKEKVNSHILMIGDAAGLIHPMCGNGMAMAIHSAQVCSSLIKNYFTGEIPSRIILEQKYEKQWNQNFRTR